MLVGSGHSAVAPGSGCPLVTPPHQALVLRSESCPGVTGSRSLGQLLTEVASVCSLLPGPHPKAGPPSEPCSPGLTWPGTDKSSSLVFSRQETFASLISSVDRLPNVFTF